jgi:hypothetical protein
MALADNQETPSTIPDYNKSTERDIRAEVRQGEAGSGVEDESDTYSLLTRERERRGTDRQAGRGEVRAGREREGRTGATLTPY